MSANDPELAGDIHSLPASRSFHGHPEGPERFYPVVFVLLENPKAARTIEESMKKEARMRPAVIKPYSKESEQAMLSVQVKRMIRRIVGERGIVFPPTMILRAIVVSEEFRDFLASRAFNVRGPLPNPMSSGFFALSTWPTPEPEPPIYFGGTAAIVVPTEVRRGD